MALDSDDAVRIAETAGTFDALLHATDLDDHGVELLRLIASLTEAQARDTLLMAVMSISELKRSGRLR